MIVSQTVGALQVSFADLWYTVMSFLPAILAAVVIFIAGWVIGILLYRVVEQVVKVLRIDDALKATGVNEVVRDAGFNLNIGAVLGTLVQWFIVIVFLMTALEVLGLSRVTIFLQQVVLLYLPQVIVAVLILVLAAIVAEAAKNIIAGSARAAGAHSGNLAGTVAKYAIWTTAVLAVLNQLGVATEFVQTLFTGIVVAIALGFGLAFGLGGKEAAARTIERVRSEVAHGR
ncbi:hypothetical protein A3A39_04910 [Candidatus Kaiserbacteria bacterium RIFCSPLOWO2_01_FULL_54_13]|uniref:Small-conductance mechanosensitive ion channel n=1 Tax=Candidatus Kaiserbacteria bacterium RIFCSPLOWO2_01_FULL_54_13 TaxID=1798512 RepID=A0A1F6F097_9BACT|nr:MAG: hypothetical protein A3A39_04910 [Candidatus Kaiserbacteria bacterium RIFCSPLOWO2_01_FULL_54_13]